MLKDRFTGTSINKKQRQKIDTLAQILKVELKAKK